MNRIVRMLPAAILAAALFGAFGSRARAQEPAALIKINLQEEKAPVPAGLYGIFMEELSHAFDGGIYAELIQNRSFEEGVLPPGMQLVKKDDGNLKMELIQLPAGVPADKWDMPWPWFMGCGWDPARALVAWSLRNDGGATGAMELTSAHPMNDASTRSLALKVETADQPGSRVALVNSGYWGIDVRKGVPYHLQFHLRPGTFQGEVTAILESGDGKVLASRAFGGVKPGTAWKKYDGQLEAADSAPQARFVLAFQGKGELQVDWVSLFPPTYKNRPNGLRPDLAKYLEDYKPDFIRYPGGCYVEGHSFEGAPDWRTMVCKPEDRIGTWSTWGYRSTDGFGYHEYLQFCEDIGADALYVTFAGMTCHPENNWPLDNLEPVIQRTLDAIEYAIGPADSKWGKVRARMGHPQPFPLKYVEIGNEHPPALYGDYYVKFRQAIKAKYPQITVIMTMFWAGLNQPAIDRAGDANIDVVDEHSYKPSGWVRSNYDYFDKYKRTPWKVYVGEYAHHSQNGDWGAAMDDSVYLMMMERNGDLVTMASYAPLFVNVNQRSWGVNLIEFDSSRSFAHASYYVQKTFNETRPDVNLATTYELTPKPDPARPLFAGKIGLGSRSTVNEFKELRVYDEKGQLVYSDDFANLDHWETPGAGQWKTENGVLKQSENGRDTSLFLKQAVQAGRVTVKARRLEGNDAFLMYFNADGPGRTMLCNYGLGRNEASTLEGTPAEGLALNGGGELRGALETGRWYEISLVLTRNTAEMLLDGKRVAQKEASVLPAFFATGGYSKQDKMVVVRATNYSDKPLQATFQLDGAASVGSEGRQIVIRSDKPGDENSLDKPLLITPQEMPLPGCAKEFSMTLPARSVNVLRIPATK